MTFALLFTSCRKDDDITPQGSCDFIDFKYYNGAQDNLGELRNNYILVGVDTTYSDIQIQSFISTVNQLDQNYAYTIHTTAQYKFKEIPLRLKSSKTCEEITQIISEFEQNTIVSYAHYTMKIDNCQNLIWEEIGNLCINSYGSNFYVKVFDENNLTGLNQKITETNTELVEQNEFMPKWFELRATKNSNGDALKMANYFYETGLFEHSEPRISKYPVE
ncbi:MAG: hypothetical protein PHD00_01280 [Bacteroidales bacterium]|jgi:hypothetical protein|nr:hypothetical protein [Bacteroidales bacterium]